VTMTGELVDCFASREQGVHEIIQTLGSLLGQQNLSIFAGESGFLAADAVTRENYMTIASANWLASAALTARRQPCGLFVDIGSTTTDIVLIESHCLQVQGYTDYQRLISGELLYTGIVRTAVMAVAQRAEFKGQEMGLMAEYFATMADVYRLTGDLNEAHDQAETADGAPKTPQASARRLSRMTGYEFIESDWALWLEFAGFLKVRQKRLIRQACVKHIERSRHPEQLTIIGAGVGRFLLREISDDLGMPYRDLTELVAQFVSTDSLDAADCAPAAAVAYLAGGFG
jgi:(4-(4-[2-(gamma-L-glutamylamino)ethyl]phenoxymethyl)furan-2-yl)methanamine synthase